MVATISRDFSVLPFEIKFGDTESVGLHEIEIIKKQIQIKAN